MLERFREQFQGEDLGRWVRNARTKLFWRQTKTGQFVPVTVNEAEWECSYVVSPYAGLVLYTQEELAKRGGPALGLAALLLGPLSFLLRKININRAVSVNNWLLSTNPYPAESPFALVELALALVKEFPEHLVFLRSLCPRLDGELMRALKTAGFTFLPSRQVLLLDFSPRARQASRLTRDFKALEAVRGRVVRSESFSASEFEDAAALYEQLYLRKHSVYNPAYTPEFLALCHATGVMRFLGLRGSNGRLEAVAAFTYLGQTPNCPLVGYRTGDPDSHALYRTLTVLALEELAKTKQVCNLSSGAGAFKRARGAKAAIDYTAVYLRHLTWQRRLGLRILQALDYAVALPLMKIFRI